jgi:hypothetical protein
MIESLYSPLKKRALGIVLASANSQEFIVIKNDDELRDMLIIFVLKLKYFSLS